VAVRRTAAPIPKHALALSALTILVLLFRLARFLLLC
jgi:hypothetical protein